MLDYILSNIWGALQSQPLFYHSNINIYTLKQKKPTLNQKQFTFFVQKLL